MAPDSDHRRRNEPLLSRLELDERTRITVAVFGFVAISGALIQIRGTLLPAFQDAFRVSEEQLGLVTPIATIGFTLATLLVGPLSGRFDTRRTMTVGVLLTGVSLVGLAHAPAYLLLLAFEGGRSFTTGVFRAFDRPVVGHLYPDSRGRVLGLLGMTWAVGAAAGPVLAAVIMSGLGFGWRPIYLVLAVVCIPLAVLTVRADFEVFDRNERTFGLDEVREVLHDPEVHTMAVSLTLVGGIESGFFTWLPYYVAQSLPQSVASLSLSIYLISYIPGRLVFSHLTEQYHRLNLLVATTVLLSFVLWTTVTIARGPALLGGMAVVGLCISGLFPTLLTIGMDAKPSFSAPVNAIGNVAARVGFLTVPAVIGVLAQLYTIGTAMLVQVVLGGLLATTTIGFRLLDPW